MPTIRGWLGPLRPALSDWHPCVWCTYPTTTMMATPGRPDVGALPLHAVCAALIIFAYREQTAGRLLEPDDVAGMARLAAYTPERG